MNMYIVTELINKLNDDFMETPENFRFLSIRYGN